ncbi:MAG: ABC-ATPase domain-containing protein [Lachnospiraceae bacterium]|nr:ABC-ATPase domain-containing protein [Lachnospiraceae bacterium]
MKSSEELKNDLRRIDHKGYPAYKQLKGAYRFECYTLSIDHVQGDPFAAPSKVSIKVEGKRAAFPAELFDTREKKIALEDYLLCGFGRKLREFSFQAKGSGKSGLMSVSNPGQEVLERTGCQIDSEKGTVTLRMEIGFPANGRTVNSRELEKILFTYLPECVKRTLFYAVLEEKKVRQAVELAEDQTAIRRQLKEQGLVAFVANDSVLPRESGVSKKPMKGAVPFQSPKEMEVQLELPHYGTIYGMGIKEGITLIVGGGYHGKSTLLKALELGVYNHRTGDGREYVISRESGMKIRAEDGRSVKNVDISMFINNLPNGKDTVHFHTEDASGSTSQAANVVEAMEAGSRLFFIDEDTSATNFMIRDELMQRVVHREVEPITPFVERVRELYETYGISTILVAGSSGSYFHKADCIIQMNHYKPVEITALAKEEAKVFPLPAEEAEPVTPPDFGRVMLPDRKFGADGRIKIKTMGMDGISINRDTIDLRYLEQLVDTEQLCALGQLMKYIRMQMADGKRSLQDIIDFVMKNLSEHGFEKICGGGYLPGNLTMIRRQELFACVNRWREIRM